MVNYVLKKVNSQINNNNQLYKEKFEFALLNFDKLQRDRKKKVYKNKANH